MNRIAKEPESRIDMRKTSRQPRIDSTRINPDALAIRIGSPGGMGAARVVA